MLSLSDLLLADTEEQVLSVLLAFLSMVGFEVDSWQPTSVPRTMLRAVARAMADQGKRVQGIAAGGYLDTAKSAWLDLLVWSHYQITRQPAVATRGKLRLVDNGGGPHVFLAGQLIFRGPGGLRYRNLDGGILGLNATLSVEVEAEAPGAKYNAVTGVSWELLTALPTVTVTNPPGTGGTWLTRPGADTESDGNVVIRAKARWPGLGYMLTTALVYRAAALAASAEVTRVRVFPHTPAPGYVRVVVAGAAGPISEPAFDAVEAYLTERLSVVVDLEVVNVELVPVPVIAVLYASPAYAPGMVEAGQQALAAFQGSLDLGQTVYLAALIEVLMGPTGMVDVKVSAPAVDTPLQSHQLASLVASLTVQATDG